MFIRPKIQLWLGILVCTTIILTNHISVVQPLTYNQVEQIAHQVTARISGKQGITFSLTTTGSAVLIARDGNIYYGITNTHVIEKAENYTLVTQDGEKHSVKADQIKPLPNVDMAVVSFTSDRDYPLVQLGDSNALEVNQTVYLTGWMRGILLYCGEKRLLQHSNQLSKEGFGLAYSNLSEKGMSGGSLLDSEGRLIAIHSAHAELREDNPFGLKVIGLGIPINTLIRLAPEADLDPGLIAILNTASSASPSP